MSVFIILTESEAGIVRNSISTATPCFMPIRRGVSGDVYILPVSILSQPVHAQWHGFLGALPQMDHNAPSFPPSWDLED